MRRKTAVVLSALAALTVAAAPAGAAEYVTNGSFETSLEGWGGYNAVLAQAAGGSAGSFSVKVALNRSATSYSLYPAPRPVSSTMAGVVYTARAAVRGDAPGATVCLRVREWSGSSLAGSAQSCLTLTTAWQRFAPVAYKALGTGRSLDAYLYQASAKAGDLFYADEISLADDAAPADTTPPDTTITDGPSGTTTSTSASFSFSATEAGSTFACSLDGAPYAACTSPTSYSGLAAGTHTFSVRATDGAGNVDGTPAQRSWTIEAEAPPPSGDLDTAIVGGPSGTSRTNEPVFTFSSSRTGATFECSLDGGAFAPCASPYTAYVATGRHTLAVRAADGGSVDPTPATRSWWSDGLLQNGNFEGSDAGWARQNYVVAGWKAYNASLAQVGGGVAGPGAVRVALASGTSYSIYSSPKPVNATEEGRAYTATGYARSDTPGRTLCLRVREFAGSNVVDGAQSCLVATSSWQAFAPVRYAARASGNELEVYVYQSTSASSGDRFDVDGITLADGALDPVLPAEGSDPVLIGVADVGSCWSSGDEAVARLLDTIPGTIGIAGDTEQNYGTAPEFAGCYDPAWGRHKWRTRPAVGDHEYQTHADAHPYFDYFGDAAGPRFKGFYSYELGSWHIVVLQSQDCRDASGCGPGTEQYEWLAADLAANAKRCTAAYFHHPRWSAGSLHGNQESVAPFWELLHRYGAEFVYGGNDHTYQRWAPQDPAGRLDANGIRQFVVGEGGTMHYGLVSKLPANVEVAHTGTFGVTTFTLRDGSYEWRFVPQTGKTFTDSGSAPCSPLEDATPPAVALTSPAAGTVVSGTVTLSADASDAGGVARVEFLADGVVVGTDDSAPWSVAWDTTVRADGDVVLKARALDAAGNTATSAAVTVTVRNGADDTTAPQTTISSGPPTETSETSASFAFGADEPGATFECSLDGAAFAACTSPATYSGLAAGEHRFEVRARDAAGNVDATPAVWSWTVVEPPPPAENLLANGGFESSTDGWRGYNAALALVGGAAEGASAARVTWSGSGSSYSIYPAPRPVPSTTAGRRYSAGGFARAAVASGSLCLRIREWNGGSIVGAALSCVGAATSWREVPPVEYVAVGSGNQLEVYAYGTYVGTGASFDVDALWLRAD